MNTSLLVGQLTIDHNTLVHRVVTGPGGSVFFAGRTMNNFSIPNTIVSPYGKDFPVDILSPSQLFPIKPTDETTLMFENIYTADGTRSQNVRYPNNMVSITHTFLAQNTRTYDVVLVAPLLPEDDISFFSSISRQFSSTLRILLPQGCYRTIQENGHIVRRTWSDAEKTVRLFDVVILSNKDSARVYADAKRWSSYGTAVIVTEEHLGCTYYSSKNTLHVPAFRVPDSIDATGAGDIFAASFAYAYKTLGKARLTDALVFANASAGLSLRFLPHALSYTVADVVSFAQRQGKSIHL